MSEVPGPDRPDEVEPWPPWLGKTLLGLLVAVVAIGAIVAFYDAGWLPLTGPFVAALLVPLILRGRSYALARRRHRLAESLTGRLHQLRSSLAEERSTAPESRSSAASDLSLGVADTHAAEALGTVGSGALAATEHRVALLVQATGEWHPDAPLTREVHDVAREARELARAAQKLSETGRRTR